MVFPSVTTRTFIRSTELHKYRTRHIELLYLPISKTDALYKTIRHRGVQLWTLGNTLMTRHSGGIR